LPIFATPLSFGALALWNFVLKLTVSEDRMIVAAVVLA